MIVATSLAPLPQPAALRDASPASVPSLPEEIWVEIFKLLSNIHDLGRASLVSRVWSIWANDLTLFKFFYDRNMGVTAPELKPHISRLKFLGEAATLHNFKIPQFKKYKDGENPKLRFLQPLFWTNCPPLTEDETKNAKHSQWEKFSFYFEPQYSSSRGNRHILLPSGGCRQNYLFTLLSHNSWTIQIRDPKTWKIILEHNISAEQKITGTDEKFVLRNDVIAACIEEKNDVVVITERGSLFHFHLENNCLVYNRFLKGLPFQNGQTLRHHFLINGHLILAFGASKESQKADLLFKIYHVQEQSWKNKNESLTELWDYVPWDKTYGVSKQFLCGDAGGIQIPLSGASKQWNPPNPIQKPGYRNPSKFHCADANERFALYCLNNLGESQYCLLEVETGKDVCGPLFGPYCPHLISHPIFGQLIVAGYGQNFIYIHRPLLKQTMRIPVALSAPNSISSIAFGLRELHYIDQKGEINSMVFEKEDRVEWGIEEPDKNIRPPDVLNQQLHFPQSSVSNRVLEFFRSHLLYFRIHLLYMIAVIAYAALGLIIYRRRSLSR